MTNPMTFADMPLAAPLQKALAEQNYTIPSPIQAQAIPLLLAGRDLIGCAQTGTGKTAAFSLPILNALYLNPATPRRKTTRVLVLTPTRELATQVGKSLETYGRNLRIRHTLIYGGVGKGPQIKAMNQGVDVLVACPGRLLDLYNEGCLDLSGVEFFVLDEVDRMLDMGFLRDVQKIVSLLPKKRQSLFFSATLAPTISKLAHTILKDPATVTIAPKTTTAEKVEQLVCFVSKDDKRPLLVDQLKKLPAGELAIVFSRTKHGSDKLSRYLKQNEINSEAIHGNRTQKQREKSLDKFRKGDLPVLVATDVAARGVDVKDVTLVVNFDLPNEAEAYVHRIGRTGRAGASGLAVSFCAPEEHEFLHDIEKLIKKKIAVDSAHPYHDAELASLHAKGLTSKESTRDNNGNKARGGGGGRGRGQGGGENRSQSRGSSSGRGNSGGNPAPSSRRRSSRRQKS